MNKLETKVIYNKSNIAVEYVIIWLHGLGADCNDFIPIVPELNLSVSVKFIFPNAPIMPITINGGMAMRAWYDILDFADLHRDVDLNGILKSIAQIEDLIDNLIKEGFSANKIVLAGFSQGAVITYYTGLSSKHNLGGLMILSGYLPDTTLLDVTKIQHKAHVPILVCHGNQDPVVDIRYARLSTKYLQQLGLNYEWHEYSMAHSVCFEEVLQISKWLHGIFKG